MSSRTSADGPASGSSQAIFVSFRFGQLDGVSIEAAKWQQVFRQAGYHVYQISGSPTVGDVSSVCLPWLSMGAGDNVPRNAGRILRAHMEGADVIVVENLLSIPLNIPAARALHWALEGCPSFICLRHHDLPWQRNAWVPSSDFPLIPAGAMNITINDHSRDELCARGIDARRIYNHFATTPILRSTYAREAIGADEHTLVMAQPTRAIPRKNVPGGLAFARDLQAAGLRDRHLYWLTGPAEGGYGQELSVLLPSAELPTLHRPVLRREEVYAAADIVVFPSLEEGFGNPVGEGCAAGLPVVIGPYRTGEELRRLDLRLFGLDEAGKLSSMWGSSELADLVQHNRTVIERRLALHLLPGRLSSVLDLSLLPGQGVGG